jgi:hypothetical protein
MDSESHEKSATGPPPFLELPLEIRRQIYDTTLALCLADQLSLLITNHQVYDEGYNFVFRRPLTFSSRLRLQSFVNSHPPNVLGQVRSLTLRLGGLAPSEMESYLRNAIMGIPVCAGDHPYVLESESILFCLRMMPGLKRFSLLPPRQRNRNPVPRELVQHLLTQMPQYWKQLESLSISTDLKSLAFLTDMPHLRSLQFSGCSDTESESAKLITQQMLCLQEIAIVGPSTAFLKRQKCSVQKGAILAITPDVLSNMQPLRRLTIRDLSPPGNPTFFTKKMLMAIFDTHQTTLQSLCISSSSQPDIAVLGLLEAILIGLPVLRELQLEWSGIGKELVSEYLPPTLQSLTVAVENSAHAQDILNGLASASVRLPYLRDIRFNLIDSVEPLDRIRDLKTPFNISTRCTAPHWRIQWGVWKPAGHEDT